MLTSLMDVSAFATLVAENRPAFGANLRCIRVFTILFRCGNQVLRFADLLTSVGIVLIPGISGESVKGFRFAVGFINP
jgi:hypothetical protein